MNAVTYRDSALMKHFDRFYTPQSRTLSNGENCCWKRTETLLIGVCRLPRSDEKSNDCAVHKSDMARDPSPP